MPTYLRPMAPVAADVILCGDPGRALALAQELMPQPRMSNHHRGLWGYWGTTTEGDQLSVHATGIGGPSAAAVFTELVRLGMRRAIRIGSCLSLDGALAVGTTVSAARILAADGAGRSAGLRAGEAIEPDPDLGRGLDGFAELRATVVSVDLPPGRSAVVASDPSEDLQDGAARPTPSEPPDPPSVVDMQSATLAALARTHSIRFAVGLVVAESGSVRLEDEPLERLLLELGRAALSGRSTLTLDLS